MKILTSTNWTRHAVFKVCHTEIKYLGNTTNLSDRIKLFSPGEATVNVKLPKSQQTQSSQESMQHCQ